MTRPPRYDLPKAAPEPLRLVQLFLNTTDHEHGRELIGDGAALRAWLSERGLDAGRVGPAGLRRAHALRDALRTLVAERRTTPPLEDAAARARLTVDFDEHRLVPQARGIDGALGAIVAVAYDAMTDGSWERLKACRNCRWAFWDDSRNRSAHWCSMQLCGNRLKVRRYRSRGRSATPRRARSRRGP
jgi:predicted RNA-binding Zn ribbon-like protein